MTLLQPKEGLPVVGTVFQLWIRPACCLLFALVWIAAGAWLLQATARPPGLGGPLLFELHAAPGHWKGRAFWSLLPLGLLGVAIFGKGILLPFQLLLLTGGLGFLLVLAGRVADQATLTIAAWPGAVQRQSVVSWEKAELTGVKHLVNFRTVHYKYSSTLKKYTRDGGIPGATTLQLRDASGNILVKIDESLDPPGKRDDMRTWLAKETGLPLEHEETQPPD